MLSAVNFYNNTSTMCGAVMMAKAISRVIPGLSDHANSAPFGHQPSDQASRPRHLSMDVQPMLKAVYRSDYRDKHNRPR